MGVMKLKVTDTDSNELHAYEYGTAKVVGSCCLGIPVGMSFLVWRKFASALYVSLQKGDDEGALVPFMYCPACGASVEVVSWEPERKYVPPVFYSGDVSLTTGLPPGGQWSGQAVAYGTLPQGKDDKDGE